MKARILRWAKSAVESIERFCRCTLDVHTRGGRASESGNPLHPAPQFSERNVLAMDAAVIIDLTSILQWPRDPQGNCGSKERSQSAMKDSCSRADLAPATRPQRRRSLGARQKELVARAERAKRAASRSDNLFPFDRLRANGFSDTLVDRGDLR
jgi:hypothetical protein